MASNLRIEAGPSSTKISRPPERAVRNYASAQPTRLASSWSREVVSSDQAIERDLRSLVARAREQRRNNDFVRHFDSLATTNIVGAVGIQSVFSPLTKKGEIDKQARDALTAAFEKWSRPGVCCTNPRIGFRDVQRLAVSSCVQSGEFLSRKIFSDRNEFGFSIQILDPQSLDPTFRRTLSGGRWIRHGIEYESDGSILAYWIRARGNARIALPTMVLSGSRYYRIPAAEICHVFLDEEIAQSRGVPWVATSLLRLQMLEAYQESALVAAQVGANKVAWITRKRARGYQGPKDSDGATRVSSEAGEIEELEDGSNVLSWDPAYPNGEFDSFVKRTLQGIASGCLVSYTTLANDSEGATFSSERSRKMTERDLWSVLQSVFVNQLVRPMTEDFIRFSLAHGAIRSGGRVYRPSEFERLSSVKYRPRPWSWAANPLQEVSAAKLEVDAGFRSRDDVIIQQYAKNPADVDEEIRISQERAAEKELALSGPSTIAIGVDNGSGEGKQ